jgi:hypothetical protein
LRRSTGSTARAGRQHEASVRIEPKAADALLRERCRSRPQRCAARTPVVVLGFRAGPLHADGGRYTPGSDGASADAGQSTGGLP